MKFGSVIEKPSWVALHNLCTMLHPTVCVFWSCYLCLQAVWIHCCRCTLQAELCIYVMCEISIDFSLPLKTMQHNNKKQDYFAVTESSKTSAFFILYSLLVLYRKIKNSAGVGIWCDTFSLLRVFFLFITKISRFVLAFVKLQRFRYENSWQISSRISNKSQQ